MIQFGKQFVEFFYRLKGVKPNNYSFFIVSENNILKYLSRLGAKKATGLDGISARFVHHCLSVETCYQVFDTRYCFRDDLKSARVVTLF